MINIILKKNVWLSMKSLSFFYTICKGTLSNEMFTYLNTKHKYICEYNIEETCLVIHEKSFIFLSNKT